MYKIFEFIKAKKLYFIIGLVIVLLAGGYFYYRSRSASNKIEYVTAAVEKQNLIVSISGSGNVAADQTVKVDPSITGIVTDLSVKAGDIVEEGQLLFKIKNDSLQAAVDKSYAQYFQSKQSLENAKAQVSQAQADLDEANKKNEEKQGTVSDSQIEALGQKISSAELGVQAAEKSVTAAYSDYKNQKETAAQRTVIAPISGTITSLNISNGDNLGKSTSSGQSSSSSSSSTSTTQSSSSSPIIIENFDTLKASVQINEVDISKVEVGQKAIMTFDAIEGLTQTGKVEKIDLSGTIDQGVVSYSVTIGFDSLDKKIKSGMSVSADIIVESKQDVLTVPIAAVKISGDTHYVQILENGAPKNVTVEIGSSNDTLTEITKGLSEGQKVISQTKSSSTSTQSSSSGNSGGIPGLNGGEPSGQVRGVSNSR